MLGNIQDFIAQMRGVHAMQGVPVLSQESRMLFLQNAKCRFLENPLQAYHISDAMHTHNVIGIDGSFFLQDHHVGLSCAVFVTSVVKIGYGDNASFNAAVYPSFMQVNVDFKAHEAAQKKQLENERERALVELSGDENSALIFLDGSIADEMFVHSFVDRTSKHSVATYTSKPQHYTISGNKTCQDIDIFFSMLTSGTRTAWCVTAENSLLYFCYLNTGSEIARIEIIHRGYNKDVLEKAIASIYEQCCKGGGYPLVLYYAHEYTKSIKNYAMLCKAYFQKKYSAKQISKEVSSTF